ncbi:MAG: sigma-54-dependent Fis family transcriptional regulator [Planctomycetota bacterium]|nr:MAG: sigma-54-dependent Fis family transcriptional regulator [Planctomycetota bacterium]
MRWSGSDIVSNSNNFTLRILFVDDEAGLRLVFKNDLQKQGHEVTVAEDGAAAIRLLDENVYDCAIVDLNMPNVDGWGVVEHLKKVSPDTDFIICTGHGNSPEIIKALQLGAFDFVLKPATLTNISTAVNRVIEKHKLRNCTLAMKSELKAVRGPTDIIGETASMQRVKTLINKIGPTDSSILILGETGTGKELVARRIHEVSHRSHMPFVAVNCGALPEHLVESELFGHKKGAFTGAETARKGLIEIAKGGTLFLDELGELDKQMQVKMLRFLESGELRRVGDNETLHVDVRIVCATNRHLQDMVSEGSFREDLFFRVNTFEIRLPPLRDRKEDIPSLARTIVARHMKRADVPNDILAPEAISLLRAHDWPGNVRELSNALEHAVILSDGKTIHAEDLPTSVGGRASEGHVRPFLVTNFPRAMTLDEIEEEVIQQTLDKYKGDKPAVAGELGIALKTLYNKINLYASRQRVSA